MPPLNSPLNSNVNKPMASTVTLMLGLGAPGAGKIRPESEKPPKLPVTDPVTSCPKPVSLPQHCFVFTEPVTLSRLTLASTPMLLSFSKPSLIFLIVSSGGWNDNDSSVSVSFTSIGEGLPFLQTLHLSPCTVDPSCEASATQPLP